MPGYVGASEIFVSRWGVLKHWVSHEGAALDSRSISQLLEVVARRGGIDLRHDQQLDPEVEEFFASDFR